MTPRPPTGPDPRPDHDGVAALLALATAEVVTAEAALDELRRENAALRRRLDEQREARRRRTP